MKDKKKKNDIHANPKLIKIIKEGQKEDAAEMKKYDPAEEW